VSPRTAGGSLAGVAAAALTGGLLAALVLATRDSVKWLVLSPLILAAVVFWVLAAATLAPGHRQSAPAPGPGSAAGRRATPAQRIASAADRQSPAGAVPAGAVPAAAQPASGTTSRNGWPAAGAVPRWRPPTTGPADPAEPGSDPAGPDRQPVNVAVPVRDGAWWQASTGGPPGRKPADRAAGPAPDRLDPAATTRVVQCPRCGDFAVDVRHEAPGFAFGCRRCEHAWRWAPGTPWPVTVVRPRLRAPQAARPEPAP
jgi:hypothetical protein